MIVAMMVRACIGILPLFPLPALPRLLGDALKRDLIRGKLRTRANGCRSYEIATSMNFYFGGKRGSRKKPFQAIMGEQRLERLSTLPVQEPVLVGGSEIVDRRSAHGIIASG